METPSRVAIAILVVILAIVAIWSFDGPQGVVDSDRLLAALWEQGGQAAEEAFLYEPPTVAVFGSGRVVALRDRRWHERILSRQELSAFLNRMEGTGLRSTPSPVELTPAELGVMAADAGTIRVRLRLSGRDIELRCTVPVPLLERVAKGKELPTAVLETIRALRDLSAKAKDAYSGTVALQVTRLAEAPPQTTVAAWPQEGGQGDGKVAAIRKLADYPAAPAVREVWVEEARPILGALFQARYFTEEEFLYRVDYRPVLPAW